MPKEKFVLLSLKEDKAKKLAQILTNESCRKILDFLAEKDDSTESEISKELNIPISTVHYNLHQLRDGGMVTADEYHYSGKGKEVLHYKLANKYIIIAPKSTWGLKEKLRSILPVLGLGVVGAALLEWFYRAKSAVANAPPMLRAMTAPVADEAANNAAEEVMIQAVPEALNTAARGFGDDAAVQVISSPWHHSIGLWFLLGVILALIVYLIIDKVAHK